MSHQRGEEEATTTTASASGQIPRQTGDPREWQGLTSAVLSPMEATSASAKLGRACTYIERSGRIERGGRAGRAGAASQPGYRVRRGRVKRTYAEPRGLSSGGLLLPVTGTEEPGERGVLRDGERAEPEAAPGHEA